MFTTFSFEMSTPNSMVGEQYKMGRSPVRNRFSRSMRFSYDTCAVCSRASIPDR